MPCFEDLFENADSISIQYKGHLVVLADKFPIRNGDLLQMKIEETNSKYKQGFSIDIKGSCEINGQHHKKGKGVKMVFWEDTAPKAIKLKIFTKQGYVWVQNFWEDVSHTNVAYLDRAHNGAAMIVEEIPNGRRYRCNDGEPDDDFDDIVFTVTRIDG